MKNPPYSKDEYEKAKEEGLDLDDWDDYVKYFGIGEEEDYSQHWKRRNNYKRKGRYEHKKEGFDRNRQNYSSKLQELPNQSGTDQDR